MVGHYFRSFDDKKRLVLPAKFRKDLGDVVYATYGPDMVLELRSAKAFESLRERLLSNNMLNKTLRKYARVLFGNTVELNADKLGRVNMPDEIINLASIKKEVAFVGVGDKVEIWNKDEFQKFQSTTTTEGSLDELAEALFKEGVEI
ncbi:MAG: division/cell wall cluster transcriptional repressor MraZ [Mycoplasma sp.]|nr:division/cell wall cluster transcriptional repressor MraZ [Mycoplasma sp.]